MESHNHELTSTTEVPTAARVISIILSMITISVLITCLTRRIQSVNDWRTVPVTTALVIMIYVDSFLFIFCTTVLSKAFSLNQSVGVCDGAILLCLLCYMSTKIIIYYFLVEKVHIIRSNNTPRMKSKLWLFNFFGVICPYVVLVILNFIYRTAYINEKGVCVIGMKRKALVPLITFDALLNVYLTCLFLHPLRKCYSFQQKGNTRMKTLVMRTFLGSVATLAMCVMNLSALTILDGEPAYLCFLLCNIDVLFTAMVLHWVTAVDRQQTTTTYGASSRKGKSAMGSLGGGFASTTGDKTDEYVELNERNSPQLKTKIEANKNTSENEMTNKHAIEVKTQHIQEVEIETYDVESEGGIWRDSQERIVKPSAGV